MQRCKYPIKTMNITQSYTGTYSHSKNYNGSPRDYPIDDNCGTTGRSYLTAASSVFMELVQRARIPYGSSPRRLCRRPALRIM